METRKLAPNNRVDYIITENVNGLIKFYQFRLMDKKSYRVEMELRSLIFPEFSNYCWLMKFNCAINGRGNSYNFSKRPLFNDAETLLISTRKNFVYFLFQKSQKVCYFPDNSGKMLQRGIEVFHFVQLGLKLSFQIQHI